MIGVCLLASALTPLRNSPMARLIAYRPRLGSHPPIRPATRRSSTTRTFSTCLASNIRSARASASASSSEELVASRRGQQRLTFPLLTRRCSCLFAVVKLPQIQKIVSARSARGLSFTAYALETLGYAISLAYAARSGFPFSTYGENLFMTAQNIVITLLILLYAPTGAGRSRAVGTAAVVMAAVAYSLWDERVTSSSTR